MSELNQDLTAKQQRFVEEYLVDLNATQAAIRAGYSEDSARQIASENLSKPYIQDFITAARLKLATKTGATVERVIQEYARLAFLDIRKAFDDEGRLLPIHQIDDDTAAAIAGIETEKLFEGHGEDREQIGTLHKVRLADKVRALDSLGEHLGMFPKKVAVTGPDGGAVKIDTTGVAAAEIGAILAAVAAAKTTGDSSAAEVDQSVEAGTAQA